jgi:hypothetical protein
MSGTIPVHASFIVQARSEHDVAIFDLECVLVCKSTSVGGTLETKFMVCFPIGTSIPSSLA